MELGKFIPALCMLLGLTKPNIAVESNCNYYQDIQPGVTYYVYNPSYPSYYMGEHSCQWHAEANSRIKLSCSTLNIPPTPNCSRDALTVQVQDDIEYVICGLSSFVVESLTNKMIIKFHSKYNTIGGRFQCELKAIEENCRCGWKNPNRIVGGVETGVNEYPMMAGLVSLSSRYLFCGSTIITKKHVITAAHCVSRYEQDVSDLAVIVGEHDISRGDETNATRLFQAGSVVIHPDYNPKTRSADVAIVKSTKEFDFSMKVGPVCLPFYYTQDTFTDDIVTALGWGTLEFGGKKSNTLMKVNLKVISQDECSNSYNITNNNMCTYAEGKDACQFDSGGPILWQNPESSRVMLAGIISYGTTCADDKPGVNTRVTSILNFILSHTNDYNYCKTY